MRICCLQHVPFERPALVEMWAAERGHHLFGIHLYESHTLPALSQLDWLVLMGGPMSVHDEEEYPWLLPEKALVRQAIDAGKGVLGVCFGGQIIGEVLGGAVSRLPEPEIGWFSVKRSDEPLPPEFDAALPEQWPAFHFS